MFFQLQTEISNLSFRAAVFREESLGSIKEIPRFARNDKLCMLLLRKPRPRGLPPARTRAKRISKFLPPAGQPPLDGLLGMTNYACLLISKSSDKTASTFIIRRISSSVRVAFAVRLNHISPNGFHDG